MPEPLTRTDAQLLAASRRDPGAFATLYRRYEPVVASYLMRELRSAELAADLTAETFAAAFVDAHRFRGESPVVGWLLGIARNLQLEYRRRGRAETRARKRLHMGHVDLGEASFERVEALIDAAAAGPLLQRALGELPAHQRDAVKAYVLEDASYDWLAERLGISQATARQRVSRGLARMRTVLDGTIR